MLDRAPGKSMADLKNALPKTWSSPTMSPHCADEAKYGVVDAGGEAFRGDAEEGRQGRGPERSAISSPSTACASRSRTAAGAWCGRHPTSRNWWWWSRARCQRAAHARHVRGDGCGAAHASRSRRVQSEDLSGDVRTALRIPASGDPVRRGFRSSASRNTGSPVRAMTGFTRRAANSGSCRLRPSGARTATTVRSRLPAASMPRCRIARRLA